MPINYNRRTATKVKDGRVQRKNRHIPTGRLGYVLDRESPGRGFSLWQAAGERGTLAGW